MVLRTCATRTHGMNLLGLAESSRPQYTPRCLMPFIVTPSTTLRILAERPIASQDGGILEKEASRVHRIVLGPPIPSSHSFKNRTNFESCFLADGELPSPIHEPNDQLKAAQDVRSMV
ncbi:hypothetical protein PM082_018668 [Marasmius tenuissimus]|nr:hypothetical protein PM082_018668 [Marasmius tenuissimus]